MPPLQLSTGAVYSLHKSATRPHVARVAAGELRARSAEVLARRLLCRLISVRVGVGLG